MQMVKRLWSQVSGWRSSLGGWLVMVAMVLAGVACVSKPSPAPASPKEALGLLEKRLAAMPDSDPWKSCFRMRSRWLADAGRYHPGDVPARIKEGGHIGKHQSHTPPGLY